jgi:hypothetical protein
MIIKSYRTPRIYGTERFRNHVFRGEVAPGLTPDSIQQKYAQMVASTWITPGCVQFWRIKNVFTRPGPIASHDG